MIIIELSVLLLSSVISYWLIKQSKTKEKELYQKKMHFHILKFDQYFILLEFKMKKAYEIIHKDRIMIYSLEATSLGQNEFNLCLRDFISLTIKFLGKKLHAELIDFFGSEDTLLFNIAEYFNTCYENDEIRKNTMDNLMSNKENNDLDNEK